MSSALFQRTHTGQGQFVDVSMLEATLASSPFIADYTVGGHRQQPSGNRALSRRPTANLFKAKDGYLLLAVNSEKQYVALMSAIGRPELEDPRFADWSARHENEPALRAIIEEALSNTDPRKWEKGLKDAGAPCASIWRVEDIIDHPQIAARNAVQTVDTAYGPLRFAGSASRSPMAAAGWTASPPLGTHTDEVLAGLGYDAAAIAELRAREVVLAVAAAGGISGPCPHFGLTRAWRPSDNPLLLVRLPPSKRRHLPLPGRTLHARLPFPNHDPRPQHGGRPRPVARHRHEERGLRQADHRRGQLLTQFVPGHVHLKDLGQLVAREIEKAGGVAKEFNPSGSMTASPWAMTA